MSLLLIIINCFHIRSLFSLVCRTENIVSCGDTIYSSIEQSININYPLIIDSPSLVHFDACNSEIDISLYIEDSEGYNISNPYCKNGDQCGKCKDKFTQNENFTIPIITPDIYHINIKTNDFYRRGMYEIEISCSNYAQNTTITIANNISQVTEPLIFNFTNTLPYALNVIWPSDGFILKYSLTDYRKVPFTYNDYFLGFTYVYHPFWKPMNFTSVLDTYDSYVAVDLSQCTCNYHKCIDCQQSLNLFDFLAHSTFIANDDFNFTISGGYNSMTDVLLFGSDALMIPAVLNIQIQRCNMSIYAENPMSYLFVFFSFSLSTTCYSRIAETFAVNISLDTEYGVDAISHHVQHQLFITIDTNRSTFSHICELWYNGNCTDIYNNSFNISYHVDMDDLSTVADRLWVSFDTNALDIYLTSSSQSLNAPAHEYPASSSSSGYSFLLLICICVCGYFCYRQLCVKTEEIVVNRVLVLIIGVSQFNDKKLFLDGVRKNVADLFKLWDEKYHYDVFVCGNKQTLYNTRSYIMQFVEQHKVKLEENHYQAVILHIVSHGSDNGNSFLSSDGKKIKLDGIKNDLIHSAKKRYTDNNQIEEPLIKIIFNHVCRGDNNYRQGKSRAANVIANGDRSAQSEYANWAVIWGNIVGRTLSDDGKFTDCICEVFEKNLNKRRHRKSNFRELITEIGIKLQSRTDAAEIPVIDETLKKFKIRFEQCKHKKQRYPKDSVHMHVISPSEKEKQMTKQYGKSQVDNTVLLSSVNNIDADVNTVEMMDVTERNIDVTNSLLSLNFVSVEHIA